MVHSFYSRWMITAFMVLCCSGLVLSQDIVINEVMSSNGETVTDEDGESPDWLELYNAGSEAKNLAGWGISDDADMPFKWVFPNVIVQPGERLHVWASGKNRVYGTKTEEAVFVASGSDWSYLDNGSNQGTMWRTPDFDESAWATGPAPLGYSNQPNYAVTTISYGSNPNAKYITTYFRKRFEVAETANITSLVLSLWIDDGAVVYLNGAELVRPLLPSAGEITYLTTTSSYIAEWPTWTNYEISTNALQEGENVLAVEVHQTSGTSSDLGFDLRLLGTVLSKSLHTNFSIGASGEALYLTRPDGTLADQTPAIMIPRDISYGRTTDGGGSWGFFPQPTPYASNNGSVWYPEVIGEPVFSQQGGFYTAPFNLSLNSDDPEVIIYYTLDGSEPDPANLNGTTYSYKNRYPRNAGDTTLGPFLYRQMRSYQYSTPLQISDRSSQAYQIASINIEFSYSTRLPASNMFKGTTVRARAYKSNCIPSRTVTHTYFVNPGMMSRYALPVISLVTDENNLFDYTKGIYVAGKVGDNWRLSNPSASYNEGQPTNFNQRGPAWERPAHIEMFNTDGSLMLSQNIGIRIHGGWSRAWFPKSFRAYARSEYDISDSFEYPIFEGLEKRGEPGTPLTSFRRLAFRNSGNDWNSTYYRDALMQELVSHLPIDTMSYRPAIHFINGEYWGMINIREWYDDDYLETHYGVDPDDVVILTLNEVVDIGFPSDADHFKETVTYALNNNVALTAHYDWICQRVDVNNLINYYVPEIYYNNGDWPHNNSGLWRKRTDSYVPDAPTGHDGRWRWLLYDTDFGLGLNGGYTDNTLNRVLTSTGSGRTNNLFRRLALNNTQFRNAFINAMADNINTSFKPVRISALVDTYNARIQSSRSEHNSRWQTNLGAGADVKTFASQRPTYMRQFLLSSFGLTGTQNLTVNRNDNWGYVQVNSVVINRDTPGLTTPSAPYPWTGQYYRGVPVTVRALPRLGYRFSHWIGPSGIDSFSDTLTLSLTSDVSLTAVFEAPALMHYWSFNNTDSLLSPAYTLGAGTATILPAAATEVTSDTGEDFTGVNNRLDETTGSHLRINNPLGASMTLNLPTTGYEAVVLRYETRRSGQGAGQQTLSYSVNGQTFTPFETYTVEDDAPQLHTFIFTGVGGVDNNSQFAVRIEFAEGDGGTAGNNRFDNITLEGISLPGTNQPPRLVSLMPLQETIENKTQTLNLASYFSDPDGDALVFSVWADKPFVVDTPVAGNILTLSPLYRGEALVTIQASDEINPPIQGSFRVLVYPGGHILSKGALAFGSWSPEEPENSFPPNILFLQSDISDPGLATPLKYAYFIPHDDYHADDQDVIGFPYKTTGRSRINGLNDYGISFINTGRDRDLGGLLMAIDTSGLEAIRVSWLAGTLLTNYRQYAIRLQYRVGHTGPFVDVADDVGPVEYQVQSDGHVQTLGPIMLPAAAAGKPYVQLLWKYYFVEGDSGARAKLRLDDLSVTVPRYPYGGQPRAIPGRVEAEEFDVGCDGMTYHDTEAGNSGLVFRPNVDADIALVTDGVSAYALDDIQDGEWLLYTVNSTAGQTDLFARIASIQAGGQIRVLLDDVLLAAIDVPNTGSLTSWQTVSVSGLHLPDKTNTELRLEMVGSGYRVNWIDFKTRRPYLSEPIKIPGRLEFENYDVGGQNISYFDTTLLNSYNHYRSDDVDILTSQDNDGGYATYVTTGEWMEYTCDIMPGTYTIVVRSSSSFAAQQMEMSVDGQLLATFALPITGGWYTWVNTPLADVYLPGGAAKVVRFKLTKSSATINYVDFIRHYGSADLSQSGRVELDDFAILAAQWQGTAAIPSADIAPAGGDGTVDLLDMLVMAENWLSEE